jgi:hypothetical protein
MGLNNVVGAISLDVNSVTINPATKEMYVATGTRGILYTPDATRSGLSWSNFSDVTSFPHAWTERVFINPYNPQDVWVATFGGGIKRGTAGASASVTSSQFLYAIAPNKISITFSADVGASAFSASSLSILSVPGSATVTPNSYSYSSTTKTGTWVLPTPLADSNYHAALSAGATLASNYGVDFSFLAADATGDKKVDLTDFTILAGNFNQSGKNFNEGNFSYDTAGLVDLSDFTILAANFNDMLPAAGASARMMSAPVTGAPASMFSMSPLDSDQKLIDEVEL